MGSEVLEQPLVDVRCLQLEFRGAASVCVQRGARDWQHLEMRIQRNPKQAPCWENGFAFL